MLESLVDDIDESYKMEEFLTHFDYGNNYLRIMKNLKSHLTKEQLEFIPDIHVRYQSSKVYQSNSLLVTRNACKMVISYLLSLDMDLNKELEQKKKDLEYREKEIAYKEKLLKESLDAINRFPELQRSKIVEETKKSHREIEKNSKDKTSKSDIK
jgi:hypothetical protein